MKILSLVCLVFGCSTVAFAAASNSQPCKINQKVPAVYPGRLLYNGVLRGEAAVVLEIDPAGKLADALVTTYTHREFAEEAIRAVKQWTFQPGYLDGQPVISIVTITFAFSVDGVAVYEKSMDSVRYGAEEDEEGFSYRPHELRALDRKPQLKIVASPIYPKAWIEQGHTGRITIGFFIDELGQTRVPSVTSGSDGLLAGAALAAVKQWRFEPPLHKGRPVLAQAEQEFVFAPPAAASDKPSKS
jgi:TonB family protein